MAIRKIREIGDPVLNKRCKEVTEITPRVQDLIDDMFETLYEEKRRGIGGASGGYLEAYRW